MYFSGGDALAPEHVKPSGMGLLLPNAALVTVIFFTFAFAPGKAASAGAAATVTSATVAAASTNRSRTAGDLTAVAVS